MTCEDGMVSAFWSACKDLVSLSILGGVRRYFSRAAPHSLIASCTLHDAKSISMRRREFTAGVLMSAAMLPARAQQRTTSRRIAIFHPAIPVASLTETGGGSAWRAFFG